MLEGPTSWGSSVVVKSFVPSDIPGHNPAEAYLREYAGLTYLRGTPDLLAHDPQATTVVMQDLGGAPTLADFLTGSDPQAAWDACLQWARALGEHVDADAGAVAMVSRELGEAEERNRREIAALPGQGLQALADWGVKSAAAALDEVEEAASGLWSRTDRLVLSVGDTCPDNALFVEGQVRFLDCEGTSLKPIAVDAAYALEPFSSCWCVFTPPSGLTDAMLQAFTQGAARTFADLGEDPNWPAQVRHAIVLWIVASGAWLLPPAQAARPSIGPTGAIAPSARQLLVKRWRWVLEHVADDLPNLALAADEALRRALREWPDGRALPGYPAWR